MSEDISVILRHTFRYNCLEKTGADLIGLATILGRDDAEAAGSTPERN